MLKYLLGLVLFCLALNSGAGTISTIYYISKNRDELDCDNLLNGIYFGVASICILAYTLVSFLYNCCSVNICCKFFTFISSLSILSATIYNLYLYSERSQECIDIYKEHDLEKYYNYYLLCLMINTILIIICGIIMYCSKKD